MLRSLLIAFSLTLTVPSAQASGPDTSEFVFPSIDGGEIALSDYAGRPVLIVNTASLCGFTPQYEGLQALYDRHRKDGLIVLAVPSDDFGQELDSNSEAKEFCELTYGLDLPMTEITPVLGQDAHPFYRWLADEHGVRPSWNFTKVLIDGEGRYVDHWGPRVRPQSNRLAGTIEALLTE